MQSKQIRTRLIEELYHIPDQHLNYLYEMIHSYRIGITKSESDKKIYIDHASKDFISTNNKQTYVSLEEGYKAMARDKDYENEANEWLFDECGECLPDQENWSGWNE